MKKFLPLLAVALLAFSSCATRSTQVKYAEGVKAEDKQTAKLAFFYLDDDEQITYLSYDAKDYADRQFRYLKKSDFLAFNRDKYLGPSWLALRPGIVYLSVFKAGYTPANMQFFFKAGSYYKIEKDGKYAKIVYDENPNLNAEVLKAQGIQ